MSTVEVQVTGLDDVFASIDALGDQTKIKQAVLAGALMVESDAKLSIMHGAPTGHVYGKHVASAPGEAPATDTGMLASSIGHDVSDDGMTVEIGSALDYATDLEYGTKNMEARPFLEPALDKNRAAILARIQKGAGGAA
jgi:HK97 gp10 family phage protein